MLIKKQNILTGKFSAMDLPVTTKQIKEWQNGKLIQDVMPNLNNVQREFLITGMNAKEQKKFYKNIKS